MSITTWSDFADDLGEAIASLVYEDYGPSVTVELEEWSAETGPDVDERWTVTFNLRRNPAPPPNV